MQMPTFHVSLWRTLCLKIRSALFILSTKRRVTFTGIALGFWERQPAGFGSCRVPLPPAHPFFLSGINQEAHQATSKIITLDMARQVRLCGQGVEAGEGNANHLGAELLARCTGLNSIFFRSRNKSEWAKIPLLLRQEMEEFCYS